MTDFYTFDADEQVKKLESLVRHALKLWGINNSEIKLLKYRENAVFAITVPETTTRYVMRIHRAGYHSDAELRSELQWMKALNEAGIQTPPVVSAENGELFVVVSHDEVPEPRQVDLLGWVDGTQIGTVANDREISLKEVKHNHYMAGQLAARIHNQSATWQKPEGFIRKKWDEEGLLGEKAVLGCFWELELLSPAQREQLLKAKEKIIMEMDAFGKTPDRYGLTHADFVPENLLTNGEDVRIIDFDDCGFGWHVMDIATSLFFLLGEPGYDAAYTELIAGYRSERDLPDDHVKMLPTFLMMRGLSYLGWLHSRKETKTAQEMGPELVEGVCALAEDYLSDQGIPRDST